MNESAVKGAERIYEAIANDEKIAFKVFHYGRDGKKIYSRNGKPYIVSPYATIWLNGYYYLYAFIDGENRFRPFRIDRLEGISKQPLGQREGKEKFRVSPLKQRDVKLFSIKQAKDYKVTLRFQNGLVDAVRDQFGSNITMIPDGEDCFTVSVMVRTSPEFYAWLFSFGRGVKILSPDNVVKKMRQYTKNIFDMYENDGEM